MKNLHIRHAKLMRQAGFHILPAWVKHLEELSLTRPFSNRYGELVYWENAQGVRIALFHNAAISLKQLVERVHDSTSYMVKKGARVVWD